MFNASKHFKVKRYKKYIEFKLRSFVILVPRLRMPMVCSIFWRTDFDGFRIDKIQIGWRETAYSIISYRHPCRKKCSDAVWTWMLCTLMKFEGIITTNIINLDIPIVTVFVTLIYWISPCQYTPLVVCIDLSSFKHEYGGKGLWIKASHALRKKTGSLYFRFEPHKETQATDSYLRMPHQSSPIYFF